MALIEKLRARWGVGLWDTIAILLAFSLAGMTIVWLKNPVIGFLLPRDGSGWVGWVVYLAIILPLYQVLLLGYGTLLGQFDFFWSKLKTVGRLLRGRAARPSGDPS